VFVLDMGEPVRIADLAADLIRLSGLEAGDDVEIEYTGIRPGEKLYEELFFSEEMAAPTLHPKVLRARQAELPTGFGERLRRLLEGAEQGFPAGEVREALRALVPDYTPDPTEADLTERRSRPRQDVVD
jgi:FlaA1/EpsC-like NDP-sugar epimerase